MTGASYQANMRREHEEHVEKTINVMQSPNLPHACDTLSQAKNLLNQSQQ